MIALNGCLMRGGPPNYNPIQMNTGQTSSSAGLFPGQNAAFNSFQCPPFGQPCGMSQMQRELMCYLFQQNLYLQNQLMRQKIDYMQSRQPDLMGSAQPAIKIEEPLRNDPTSTIETISIGTLRCIQQRQPRINLQLGRKKKLRKAKPQKNETKNIPKNYGKAIVSFIENNKELVKRVIGQFPSLTFISFMTALRNRRNKINSIADLRAFWLESEEEDFPKVARILSSIFLRYFSLEYIFNSRISNYSGHVKYRTRLIEALRNPANFTSIKQY